MLVIIEMSKKASEPSRREGSRTDEFLVDLGTHVHCAVLEPDVFIKDYIKMPEFDARSKAGREARSDTLLNWRPDREMSPYRY